MDRRAFVRAAAGLAVAGGFGPALAAELDAPRPFARLLPGNRVARSFQAAPAGLTFPEVALGDGDLGYRLSRLRGQALLVPLWSEWCTACFLELRDLADLDRRQRGRTLILPILTASRREGGPALAKRMLDKAGANRFAPTVELPQRGHVLFDTLADKYGGKDKALPCTLAIGPDGRILGRAFGAAFAAPKPNSTADEVRALAESGQLKTTWAHPDADAFLAALGEGRLNGA